VKSVLCLGPSNDFTLLNGWIGQCVRLSRLLVGFRTYFKSLHFHSFIHSYQWSYSKVSHQYLRATT